MIVLFIVINLLMLLAAHLAAYHYFKESSLSEQLITVFLIYTAQITMTMLFLGVIVQNLDLFWLLFLNGAIAMLVIFMFRASLRDSFTKTRLKLADFSMEVIAAKDLFLYLFILLFVTQVVMLLIKIYYLPAHVWDAFAYHLHPLAEWSRQNLIPADIDSPVSRINRNPMGSRLLQFWFFKLGNDIRWIELPQMLYGLMVPLSAYAVMRKLTIKRTTAGRYAILIYFIPLILIQSRTCQDHLVLTGITIMALLYFLNVFYARDYRQLPFLAIALGVLLGIKISSPHIIAVLFAALLFSKGWNGTAIKIFLKTHVKPILVGIAIVFLMGGYWFFKTSLISGTYALVFKQVFSLKFIVAVFFIVLLVVSAVFVSRKFQWKPKHKQKILIILLVVLLMVGSYGIYKHIGLIKSLSLGFHNPTPELFTPDFNKQYPMLAKLKSRFLSNLLVFPFRIKDIGLYTGYTPDFLETSGFGIQFFSFGLLAYLLMGFLLVFKWRDSGPVLHMIRYLFFFSSLLLLSYFVYYFTPPNYRMFMFFPVFGLILWAYIIHRLELSRIGRLFVDSLILIMLVFNFISCFFEGNMDHLRWKTVITLDNPIERTPVKYSTFFNHKTHAWKFIDMYIPANEPIGYTGHDDSWVFPYFDNQLKRNIHYLKKIPGYRVRRKKNVYQLLLTNQFINELQQRNIHYIHINPQGWHYNKPRTITIDDKRAFTVVPHLFYIKW